MDWIKSSRRLNFVQYSGRYISRWHCRENRWKCLFGSGSWKRGDLAQLVFTFLIEATSLEDNRILPKCSDWGPPIWSWSLYSHFLYILFTEEWFILLKARGRLRLPWHEEARRSMGLPRIQRARHTHLCGTSGSFGLFQCSLSLLHFIPHFFHYWVHVARRGSFWVLRKGWDYILSRSMTFLRQWLTRMSFILTSRK